MRKSKLLLTLLVLCVKYSTARSNSAFDLELYENVLDPRECERQLTYIRNNTGLMIQFIDASWRLPRSILKANFWDLGNYFQCLDINENVENLDMSVEGKFCAVNFPFQQDNFELPTFPSLLDLTSPEQPLRQYEPNQFFTEEIGEKFRMYQEKRSVLRMLVGDTPENTAPARTADTMAFMTLELGYCIPKVCTARQAVDFFSNNLTRTLEFEENYCRLPNDKKWVAADTVAVIILSIIGVLTLMSTAYDINYTFFQKRDPKQASNLYKSFSVYDNGKKFFIFPSGKNVMTCLDGIRSFAMIWVIVGHTYVTQLSFMPENLMDMLDFVTEFSSLYITSGPITVDTFFLISGILVVYTTASKMSGKTLLKNLHLYYLSRLLRMFPVLAFGILLTASFLHRTVDGPNFTSIAAFVDNCRSNWWSTLLYVQNFVNPSEMCLPHSWYLAIDMQLHIFSPVVLLWVLGQRRRTAWFGLCTALIAFLIGSGVYNFINNFQSSSVSLGRPDPSAQEDYMNRYYFHTLPRASPFFVGMIYGYVLHLYREKTPKIPMPLVLFFWAIAFSATTAAVIVSYWNSQPDWDNQLMDNIINTFKRPLWAAGVGWIIFACHHGYGGPINWVLSLTVFKILGRLSYAMYILHYPLIYLILATSLNPVYFAPHLSMYRFFVDFSLAAIAAFLVTIVIDFPFANLIKMGMDLVVPKRRPQTIPPQTKKEQPNVEVSPEDPNQDEKSMNREHEKKDTSSILGNKNKDLSYLVAHLPHCNV